MEHVCLNGDVYIYDCIEFNDSLRYCDVASEIALLAVSLDYVERSDLAKELIETYASMTGDEDLLKILNFYKCFRAFENGSTQSSKISSYDDRGYPVDELVESAGRYFELAESYIS